MTTPDMDVSRILGFRWELEDDGRGSLYTIMTINDSDPFEMCMMFGGFEAVPAPMRQVIRADGRRNGEFPPQPDSN